MQQIRISDLVETSDEVHLHTGNVRMVFRSVSKISDPCLVYLAVGMIGPAAEVFVRLESGTKNSMLRGTL